MLRYCRHLRITVAAANLLCGSIATAQLPAVREPVPVTAVDASADRVWASAVEFIALSRIPVRIMDGTARFVQSDPFYLSLPDSTPAADCGKSVQVRGLPAAWGATAKLTLWVRQDGEKASVRAVAEFTQSDRFPCGPSNGSYERLVQEAIRDRATRR